VNFTFSAICTVSLSGVNLTLTGRWGISVGDGRNEVTGVGGVRRRRRRDAVMADDFRSGRPPRCLGRAWNLRVSRQENHQEDDRSDYDYSPRPTSFGHNRNLAHAGSTVTRIAPAFHRQLVRSPTTRDIPSEAAVVIRPLWRRSRGRYRARAALAMARCKDRARRNS